MAAISVHLDIVSLEKQIFSGLVEMVVANGAHGELGVLPGHAALLTPLRPGTVRIIKQGGKEELYYTSGGTLEVQPDVITILADTVVRASDLDEAKAIEVRENAERLLVSKKDNLDFSQALLQLAQAAAQLKTLKLQTKLTKK
ncbi:MAG: F0F1 ATP synthase subunit epsilon [Gammaproteobacteria bacterium GWE2_37_16]|nr:MAG: F0F1 ATP synthase subunit epsilon [Gammaproteobacteria bacterium GWE2_37_16]